MTSSRAKLLAKPIMDTTEEKLIHVLYVDDEVGLLRAAKSILEIQGPFSVETAVSVKKAMQKMKEKTFDVIVSDYQMPKEDGLDFLKKLRETGNKTPFILFTGKGREAVAVNALNLGADRYFNKIGDPVAVYGELAHGIRSAVRARSAEEELIRLSSAVKTSTDGIVITDLTGKIIDANEATLKMYGTDEKADLIGKNSFNIIVPEDQEKALATMKEALEKGYVKSLEYHVITKTGSKIPVEMSIAVMKAPDGKPVGFVGVARDITERKRMEKALRESEERFRQVVENSGEWVWEVDANGLYTYASPIVEKILGYKPKEIVGKKHFYDLFHPEDQKELKKAALQAFAEKKPFREFFNRNVHKNGNTMWLSTSGVPIVDDSGNLLGYRGSDTDITEQKKVEEALRESGETYRELINGMNDTAWVIDFDCGFIDVNDAAVRVLGYSREELLSMKIFDIDFTLPPEEVVALVRGMPKDEVQVFQTAHTTKDGKTIPVEISSSLVTYQGKQAILSIARDITDRKRMEKALRESEERFRQVVENSGEWVWEVDANGLYTYASPAVEKILGCKPKEIVGKKHFYDLFHPEDQKELKKAALQAFAEKKPFREFFNRNVHKNGKTVWLSTSGVPIVDDNGNFLGYRGSDTDITERKEIEQQLKTSEEKYRKQFEKAMDAILLAEAETGIIVDCNTAATKLFGRKKSELVGKHQRTLHPPEPLEGEFTKGFKQHRREKGGQVLEEKIITKNGEIRDVLVNATTFELGGKTLLQGTFRDITDRKKAEAALRESEKRFRELSELLPEVVFETDATGLLTFVNQAAYERFGYSRADFSKGLTALQMLAPEDQKRGKENIARTLRGEKVGPSEYRGMRKDGTRFSFIINSTPVMRGNKPVGLRGVIVDITERKKAELKLERIMDEVVTINEKLGVVGRLTRHDARNKLSVIANNVYLTKQSLAANHGALEHLGDIESAIGQIEEIFDFARTYELLGVEELSYMSVKENFDEAAALFSGLDGVKLVNECQGLTVMADSLLRTLFYNLIDDTLKHGEKVSKIRLYHEEEKNQLKLIYEDDGVGVPYDEKEKIFEEGYGKGTGYGLYLIKKICEEYSWTIQETGKPRKGVQFTMSLPEMNKLEKKSYIIK